MGKKKDGVRIPKEIGGVKVPKKARKLARKALKAARDPAARQVAVAAMGVAAAALAGQAARARAPRAERNGRAALDEALDELRVEARRLGDRLREAFSGLRDPQ